MSSCQDGLDGTQKIALDVFLSGKSVALIGGGGSGKSHLLRTMIKRAEERVGSFPFVAPCAHSNKTAESLNGVTIHKLFGAKPSWEFSKEYLLEGLKTKPRLCEQLMKIQILVIDEISLLTSNVIDAIDHVLRHYSASEWHASLPLGGRQLVVSGDPYQLEPFEQEFCVQRDSRLTFFQSRTWYLNFGPPGHGVVFNLKNNHRQSEDPLFFSMLNCIRVGKHTDQDIEKLNSFGSNQAKPPVGYTRLCLKNDQVTRINETNLAQIPGPLFRFQALDYFFSGNRSVMEKKLDSVAPRVVSIKEGAHVIITRPLQTSNGIILPGVHAIVRSIRSNNSTSNKAKGNVIVDVLNGLSRERANGALHSASASNTRIRISQVSFEVHRFDRTVVSRREQLPSIPFYAITIHRSQGMTFSQVAIDFHCANHWKPHGMAYVALSRCKSTNGLWITGLKTSHISVSRRAKTAMKELWELHLHMPNRIWGVSAPNCLHLSCEDVARFAQNVNAQNDIKGRESQQDSSSRNNGPVSPNLMLESFHGPRISDGTDSCICACSISDFNPDQRC